MQESSSILPKQSAAAASGDISGQAGDYWGWQESSQKWEINPRTGKMETPKEREDRLEMEHLQRIYASFDYYSEWQIHRINRKEGDYKMLPIAMKNLIPNFPKKFQRMRECVNLNQRFLNMMTRTTRFPGQAQAKGRDETPSSMNMSKVQSTLKQCVRDWAEEGEVERQLCYGPVLNAIRELYPTEESREGRRVLNPGCGLGRLSWELARMGFATQGNEFSYFMLLCHNVIVNELDQNEVTIYPYIHQVTNQWSFEKQARGVKIPSVDPRIIMQTRKSPLDYSICAGDFTEIYKEPASFDVIASCFFLDTAKNVLEYLKVITYILKPGGHLVNLGPLLYHFEDSNTDPSIELTYEELRSVLPHFGLKMIKEERGLKATYTRNCDSMLRMHYECVLFVCEKVECTLPIGLVHNPAKSPKWENEKSQSKRELPSSTTSQG